MNKEYTQGFIDKCAEAGVDPEQLVKAAARGDISVNLIRALQDILHTTPGLAGSKVKPMSATLRGALSAKTAPSSTTGALALGSDLTSSSGVRPAFKDFYSRGSAEAGNLAGKIKSIKGLLKSEGLTPKHVMDESFSHGDLAEALGRNSTRLSNPIAWGDEARTAGKGVLDTANRALAGKGLERRLAYH